MWIHRPRRSPESLELANLEVEGVHQVKEEEVTHRVKVEGAVHQEQVRVVIHRDPERGAARIMRLICASPREPASFQPRQHDVRVVKHELSVVKNRLPRVRPQG